MNPNNANEMVNSILYGMIPAALVLGATFVAIFVIFAKSGQWDDLETPQNRILLDTETGKSEEPGQCKQ